MEIQANQATTEESPRHLLISNRYRLERLLGKGSFGQVYQAEDLKFHPPRLVALKLLHPQFLADPQVREDLEREAGILARFHHPNILRVSDFEVGLASAFIVTDLAEGGTLASKIRPHPSQPPHRLPLDEVAWYLDQLAEALDEAHLLGLVHRDIKPLNILLDKRGYPLLADFGLAAALSSSQSSVLVETNASGTPLYMAPEQWQGQAGKASDIYSLGVVTYQLITGRPPFGGNQAALAYQHCNTPVPHLSEKAPDLVYPSSLDTIIAAAMAKDPHQRLRPAHELARQFREALTGVGKQPVIPKPASNSSVRPVYQQPSTVSYELETRVARPLPQGEPTTLSLKQSPANSASEAHSQPAQAVSGQLGLTTPSQSIETSRSSLANLGKGRSGAKSGILRALGMVGLLGLAGLVVVLILSNQAPNREAENTPVVSPTTLHVTSNAESGKESLALLAQNQPGPISGLTPVASNTGSSSSPAASSFLKELEVPLYAGLRPIEWPQAILTQISKNQESSPLPLVFVKGEPYATAHDLSKIKAYYQSVFVKGGSQWKNFSLILPGAIGMEEFTSELEGAGGFVLFYHRANYYLEIAGLPYSIYKLSGGKSIGPGESVLILGLLMEKS